MARRSTKPTGTNIDGRLARTARTRDQIVDTLLQLVQEGAHGATLAEIAARAGVTQRTLFNHFPNIGDAVGAALMRSREVSLSLLPAVPAGATPESRVRAFFAAAVQFYEHYSAMRWAALTSPYAVAGFDLRQGKGFVLARLEERVLEACDVIDATLRNDAARRAALLVVIDPLAWRLLRTQQTLSAQKAAEAMTTAVVALCNAGGKAKRRRGGR